MEDLEARARAVFADPRMTKDIMQWFIEMGNGHAAYHGIDRRSHRILQDLGLADHGKRVRCSRLGKAAFALYEDGQLDWEQIKKATP